MKKTSSVKLRPGFQKEATVPVMEKVAINKNNHPQEKREIIIEESPVMTEYTGNSVKLLNEAKVRAALKGLDELSAQKVALEGELIAAIAQAFEEKASAMNVNQSHVATIVNRLKESKLLFAGPVSMLKEYSINRTIKDTVTGFIQPLDRAICTLAEELSEEFAGYLYNK